MEGPPFTGPRSKQLCEFIPYDNEGSDEDARSPTSELYTGGWAWKQVKIGKDRTEYQYLVNVKASRPKTPDPGERIPRRHLKKLLKKWRLDLHEAAQAAQRMEESRKVVLQYTPKVRRPRGDRIAVVLLCCVRYSIYC
eukprot:GEMP01121482.1.p1 GENE.GEMP01121482.1~~GEMP01121482.1.p1  ORF type:complete len:138 (+),score=16.35 GEMP01121482.1:73-486(+)